MPKANYDESIHILRITAARFRKAQAEIEENYMRYDCTFTSRHKEVEYCSLGQRAHDAELASHVLQLHADSVSE